MTDYVDRVHCNNCGANQQVERGSHTCRSCGRTGTLTWLPDDTPTTKWDERCTYTGTPQILSESLDS